MSITTRLSVRDSPKVCSLRKLLVLCLSYNLLFVPYLDLNMHSAREWRQYILTRGVFGNALKFSHFQDPGDVDRTPMGAGSDTISDRSVRNRIRFFLTIVKPFVKRSAFHSMDLSRYREPDDRFHPFRITHGQRSKVSSRRVRWDCS